MEDLEFTRTPCKELIKNFLNIVSYVYKEQKVITIGYTEEFCTYGLQGTQLSGRYHLALLKESLLSILEVMEDTSIFPCLKKKKKEKKKKRLSYGHSTPNATLPTLYLHSSARMQG